LSISLHVYANDPKDCFVMINDKLLRPGEFLSPGLRLEQVTPDGVIIGYKGYRFRRAVR
jgi:general secretion pathway protein B